MLKGQLAPFERRGVRDFEAIEGISRRKKTIKGEYIILTAYELPMSWDHMPEMESMVTTHSNI